MTTALITVIGTILATSITLIGVLSFHVLTRVHKLEEEVEEAQDYNHRLWWYCRRLLDMYYRHRSPGSPDPDPIPTERGNQ